ncbi:MAG TPA: histidine kinase [Puia sp.]|jgi:sensor histidine kinase YesM|nr:histidine kinase [Puia sp.]
MVYHALFWLCYYVFGALISLSIHHIYDPRFYAELLSLLPPDMLMVYVNLYLLVPAFLLTRKYPLYFLTVLLTMSATSAINIWLHHLYTINGSPFFSGNSELTVPNFATQLINCIYLVGLTTGLKFFKDSMEQRRRIREQEKQQIALELNFLKAQVHPHFFFNTLNNLYSLTLQKSDLAPEVVLKLSSLMSYMLYESSAPYVPLEKEIANLEDYIALERLRFGNRLSLSFEKDVSPNPPQIQSGSPRIPPDPIRIPPLILLTFVENSFKHGISQTIGDGRIDISIKADRNNLLFSIGNSIAKPVHPAGEPLSTTNGLGLKNVIRRLDLLYGPNYRLDRSQTPAAFHITLKIPLT